MEKLIETTTIERLIDKSILYTIKSSNSTVKILNNYSETTNTFFGLEYKFFDDSIILARVLMDVPSYKLVKFLKENSENIIEK